MISFSLQLIERCLAAQERTCPDNRMLGYVQGSQYSVGSAVCSILFAVCSVQYVVCNVQCEGSWVTCANCSKVREAEPGQNVRGNTLALWHSGILALWYSGTLVLWYSRTLALWHSGTMTLWHSGTLALWHSGTLVL